MTRRRGRGAARGAGWAAAPQLPPQVPPLLLLLAAAALSAGTAAAAGDGAASSNDYAWVDAAGFLRGRHGFGPGEGPQGAYARLPGSAKGRVRDAVWSLAQMAAGLQLAFETAAPSVAVRWRVGHHTAGEVTVPLLLCAGADAYVWDDFSNRAGPAAWEWVGDARNVTLEGSNVAANATFVQLPMFTAPHLPAGGHAGTAPPSRSYLINLPMYNEVLSFELGLPAGHEAKPWSRTPGAAPETPTKPLVWYGTSITQGASASRPGMATTNIVARALGLEILNFGFSGNGIMETSVGAYLAQVDAAGFLIDCLHNMRDTGVEANLAALVRQLRAASDAPIILAEGLPYGRAFEGAANASRDRQLKRRAAQRAVFDQLQAEGVAGLFYGPPGDSLLADLPDIPGVAWQPTVAGTHPTDQAMAAMAAAWFRFLPGVLFPQPATRW